MTSDPFAGFPSPRVRSRPTGAVSLIDSDQSDIFFSAVETTRMPMIITDPRRPDNPIVFANRAFLEMTGYAPDELIGRNCRFLQGPDTDREAIEEVKRAIAERREVATEVLNYRKDGTSFWNALFVSPVFDDGGELVYYFGSQLDVTRRRDAEDSLRQAQKMEALGQLTGGIAHDFNNLLQVMSGYLELIHGMATKRDINHGRLVVAVDQAQLAASKATRLTQQLLAFSRQQKLEGRLVNLNTLVTSITKLATNTLGENIELSQALASDLWNCRVDPTQAEVALLNILINARDALVSCSLCKVTIETQNIDIGEGDTGLYHQLSPGRYVCISVTDTGTGMPPEVAKRVMDPFFTTKDEGKGTGLGLSMVYGFAKQSKGTVRIYSEVDRGTTVRLYFPAEAGKAVPAERAIRSAERGGTERILVVEDRDDVADLAEMLLQEGGYSTTRVPDGRQALELVDAGERFDLVFTDIIMPGSMNGVTLAREVQRRLSNVAILLTTGYAEAGLERTDVGGSEFEVINKPYTKSQLLRRVRIALDGPTGVG